VRRRHRDENELIETVRRRFAGAAPRAPRGIGDDAAVLPATARRGVVSADCLIESIHFRRGEPAFLLGRKALAVNVSDVAAMGAVPTVCLLVLGIPPDLDPGFLDALLDGLASSAREHDVQLVGGDTSGSPGPLFVSITILGELGRGRQPPLTRTGARVGDAVFVSGPLGSSAAGRWLLESGWRPRLGAGGRDVTGAIAPRTGPARAALRRLPPVRLAEALRRHLDPRPRTELGRRLRGDRIASAAIDLSDGLSTDLNRLAEASGVGARILAPAVPIGDPARAVAAAAGVDPLGFALDGGEDYELLFTVRPSKERLAVAVGALAIGRITSRRSGVTLAAPTGRSARLPAAGFDHLAPVRRRH